MHLLDQVLWNLEEYGIYAKGTNKLLMTTTLLAQSLSCFSPSSALY